VAPKAGGHILVVHVLILAFLAEAKELLGHVQGGEGQDPRRVPAGGVAAISRARPSTKAASLRTYSGAASLRIGYFWPRISMSTRCFSAI